MTDITPMETKAMDKMEIEEAAAEASQPVEVPALPVFSQPPGVDRYPLIDSQTAALLGR